MRADFSKFLGPVNSDAPASKPEDSTSLLQPDQHTVERIRAALQEREQKMRQDGEREDSV
jgi:hypothetical protein